MKEEFRLMVLDKILEDAVKHGLLENYIKTTIGANTTYEFKYRGDKLKYDSKSESLKRFVTLLGNKLVKVLNDET